MNSARYEEWTKPKEEGCSLAVGQKKRVSPSSLGPNQLTQALPSGTNGGTNQILLFDGIQRYELTSRSGEWGKVF